MTEDRRDDDPEDVHELIKDARRRPMSLESLPPLRRAPYIWDNPRVPRPLREAAKKDSETTISSASDYVARSEVVRLQEVSPLDRQRNFRLAAELAIREDGYQRAVKAAKSDRGAHRDLKDLVRQIIAKYGDLAPVAVAEKLDAIGRDRRTYKAGTHSGWPSVSAPSVVFGVLAAQKTGAEREIYRRQVGEDTFPDKPLMTWGGFEKLVRRVRQELDAANNSRT